MYVYICVCSEVISVLSLERRYHILSRVSAANEGQNMIVVTRAIKLILPSLECDNPFITYLCFTWGKNQIYLYFHIIYTLSQTSFSAPRRRSSARIFDGHALLVRAKYQVCGAGTQREHSVQTYDKCTSYLLIGIIYKY